MTSTIQSLRVIFIALSLILAGAAQAAAATRPDELVKSTTEDVLGVIAQTNDRQRLLEAAEAKVVPNFDFARMTQLAVGRGWAQATPEQRQSLQKEFQNLLVRTYVNALAVAKQRKATVQMTPLRGDPNGAEVTVKSRVLPSGGQPIAIDYQMENSPSGWKVFDVIVDHISLVTNYRDSFAEQMKNGGVDGLIKALQEKNRTLAGKG